MIDDLRSLGEDGLVALLLERPALVDHCGSLSELARFVDSAYAQSEALCHTNAFEHAAAEVIAGLGPLKPAEVATALGLAPGAPEIDRAIATLARLLLATRMADGRVAPASGLPSLFGHPLGLGRPLAALVAQFDLGAVRRAAELLRRPKAGSKVALVTEVGRALGDGETVRAALAGAPPGTDSLLETALEAVVVDVGYGRPPPSAAWLMERLMLVRASAYGGPAELVREVALALRGPVLAATSPTPPPLRGRAIRDVDAVAAHAISEVITLLGSVLDALAAQPAKAIQSGELGVRDLRRLAKAAETDEATTGRLLEMARSAGLAGTVVTPVVAKSRGGNRWQPTPAPLVEWLPTTTYDAWLALDPGSRWAAVAGAWLDGRAWPSCSGARGDGGKTTGAFSRHDDAVEAPRLRRLVLDLLAALGPDEAAAVTDLAAAVSWHQCRAAAWTRTDSVSLVEGILAEARLLGVVTDGALSTLGRTLLGDREAAGRIAGQLLPATVREILVQADLSAIATAPLERDVAEELSSMADVESRGVATIWRFSEASIRRALDGGAAPERMLAFLEDHAAKGVPQPLRYLVNDAARRHGKLRVAAASTVITSDDPALLAEVRAARKTARLKLRELAPTVLASPTPVETVLLTLRAAGFLPAEERGDGIVSIARPERRRAAAAPGPPPRPSSDRRALARRLLKEPKDGRRTGIGLLGLVSFAEQPGGIPDDDEYGWWAADEEAEDEDGGLRYHDAHDLLAHAASTGTEVVVLATTGRKGTEAVGTVVMLNRSAVVLRDDYGRQKTLPLASIVSVWEDP
ncbi:MAG: helicase-associated domain-containing protein [Acidimicrobiales bacterium]